MNIERMKRIHIQDFLFFPFLCCVCVWGGGGRTGQGRVGQDEVLAGGVGAISFICDALYQPNTHCFTFS